jgi:hypothetical protein
VPAPKNRFDNPADGTFYVWHKNHDPEGENEAGKTLPITRVPNTAGGVAAYQQGDDGPFILQWKISIVHREQVRQMWRWYAISKAHTIYLTDFDGQKYEGIISTLTMARKGKLQSVGRDPSMLYNTVEATFGFTVVNFLIGDLHDMGVIA